MRHSDTRFERVIHIRSRMLSLGVLNVVAFLSFVMFGASGAYAACGDYLSQESNAGHYWNGHDQRAGSEQGFPMGHAPHRAPCHGRSCQQGIPHPLLPPVVSMEPQDRWGWTPGFVIPVTEPSSFPVQHSEPVASRNVIFRLDRPPKI